jgi:uncharacterized phiE125 gp8 family phage protein
MSSILLTPPAVEPVALTDAKAWLRVEHDDDDDVIAALIAGARCHVEAQTRRALITQEWRLVRESWPSNGRIAALPVPLVAITAARVRDGQGGTQSLDLQAFTVDAAAAPAIIAFAPWALPVPEQKAGGVEIDITCGYGGGPGDVPPPLRQAIRLLLAHWYENRGLVALGDTVAVLPATVAALIAPYRVLSL